MSSSKLNPRAAREHLQSFRFADLFIEDLGWNHPDGGKPMVIEQDGVAWKATEISQLSGFRVFEVAAADADTPFPDAKTQQAIWKRVAPHAVENLLIFVDAERTRSAWLWMKREGSADSPTRRAKTHPRRHHYLKGQPGDLFLSKLASLVVDLSELDEDGNIPITETAKRVRAGLDIETVTKAFFKDFQEEHGKLLEAIEGIPDPGERRWYASVLLNRLMFIWFLQKKASSMSAAPRTATKTTSRISSPPPRRPGKTVFSPASCAISSSRASPRPRARPRKTPRQHPVS
jgi:hypothetical protein